MIELSDEDILSRLTTFEDAFVERKSTGDMRDLLKTAVAFANSTPIGYPAILFYGVSDRGIPEGKSNLESLQKTISQKLSDAYPAIYYLPKALQQDGKQFLAVIIPGSENRPHFAGQSYIRDGSQTKEASTPQFEQLIAERNSKVRYISQWKGKQIAYRYLEPRVTSAKLGVLTDCNQHYVVVDNTRAVPLECVLASRDGSIDRLRLDFKYAGS